MNQDYTSKYIHYLTQAIDKSLIEYKDTGDVETFNKLKKEMTYINNIFEKEQSLANINKKRFNAFIQKLNILFEKYYISTFDVYGNALKLCYENDIHRKYVKNLRSKNLKKGAKNKFTLLL